MSASALESLVATMTLAELATRSGKSVEEIVAWALGEEAIRGAVRAARAKAKPAAAAPRRGRSRSVNTRTPAGRDAYDRAVLDVVKAASGPVGAQTIRKRVGGTALQVRTALNRLIESGSVKYQGRARATQYFPK